MPVKSIYHVKGKRIRRRKMQRPNCKCKYKCADTTSEENQQTIFQNYWKNNYSSQRDFIKRHVTKKEKSRKTKESTNIIFFKYYYSDAYQMPDVNQGRRKTVSLKKLQFERTRMSISAPKCANLMSLCNKELIPFYHHSFYENLPRDRQLNKLQEPRSSDRSDDNSDADYM